MREEALTWRSRDVTLAGTLALPDGPGPHPAALLVVGSGEIDRNSDHRKLPLGVTRELARELGTIGVATLRYDKRGVGESGGEFLTAGLRDNVADAAAAFTALRSRAEIDENRVVVIGHSEGAIIAARLAAELPVAGVVLLSLAVRTGEETLRWQAQALVGELPGPVRAVLRALRIDPRRQQSRLFAKVRASEKDAGRVQGAKMNLRWMREFLDHDPRGDLVRITAPVLAITGTHDLQVPVGDLPAIAAAVPAPVESHPAPEVTHLLRADPEGGSPRRYRRSTRLPLDPSVTAPLARWLRETLRLPSP